jgi:hypothetical protein
VAGRRREETGKPWGLGSGVFVRSFVRSPADREGSSILLIEGWGSGDVESNSYP